VALYRRSAFIDTDTLQLSAAACCDMGCRISAQRGIYTIYMRLISVEKDWKHVLMQKVVTLSTAVTLLADIPAATHCNWPFSGPPMTITGSLQSLQRLKKTQQTFSQMK